MLCPDKACAEHGLKAEHFNGAALKGAAVQTAVEANIQVSLDRTGKPTSIRWTGYVTPSGTGEHRFRYESRDAYRLLIDGKVVAESKGGSAEPTAKPIALEAGHAYPIRVEAVQSGEGGRQRLLWTPPGSQRDVAVDAAKKADLVVFVGGLTANVEGEEMRVEAPGFSGGDRTSLDLPKPQEELLEAVQAAGKPVVLVLLNGSALGINWADAHVPAIVEAWYPGGEGGSAVAQLLAGDFSPAGRLPVTFYKSVDQLPDFENYATKGRTYRYFAGEPLYPFGYGLSYTSFRYGKPKLSARRIAADGAVTVSVDVSNAGAVGGDEVVQLYTSHPDAAGAPIRSLAGFTRVHLQPGETKTVALTLKDRALSVVDEQGVRRIPRGTVKLWIGGGQPVARAGVAEPAGKKAQFRVTSEKTLPE
jgi:beta-glucosidase